DGKCGYSPGRARRLGAEKGKQRLPYPSQDMDEHEATGAPDPFVPDPRHRNRKHCSQGNHGHSLPSAETADHALASLWSSAARSRSDVRGEAAATAPTSANSAST